MTLASRITLVRVAFIPAFMVLEETLREKMKGIDEQ